MIISAMDIIYLNGKYIKKEDAKVSVFDRGFLFADGIYEVIPYFNKKFFRFEEHIKRLNRSLTEMKIPIISLDWKSLASELIEKNNLQNENVG